MKNNINCTALLKQFFSLYDCPLILEENNQLTFQLTEEMDKKMMNRPFYWQYVTATGNKGQPSQITFLTDVRQRKQAQTHYFYIGSEKFFQIFSLIQTEKYIQLFETVDTGKQTMLIPWLLINLKITYAGKQIKEELFSFGMNLINGMVCLEMMERLDSLPLASQISDYCYLISPIISKQSAFEKIETYCNEYLSSQKHHWAVDSLKALQSEKILIDNFFIENNQANGITKDKLYEEAEARFTPKIKMDMLSGGMVYLKQGFIESK